MTQLWLRRTISGVEPVDEDNADTLRKWKLGDVLVADVRKPRNAKLHRKAFVLLGLVFPHQDSFASKDALRKAMTIAAGFVEPVVTLDGEILTAPRSWEFTGMDDVEFQELYSNLVDVALRIVPGSSRDDWSDAVDNLVRM